MDLHLNIDFDPSKSTTFYLWEILYVCSVPWLHTTSPEYIKMFGVPSTGDPGMDKTMGNQWIDTALPIYKMAELFKADVPVKIKRHRDTEEIYFHVQRHLDQAARHVQSTFNGINQKLLDDLATLDQFAQKIYPHASEYLVKRNEQGGLFSVLSKMGMMNRPSMAIRALAAEKKEDAPQAVAQREGMGELIRSIRKRQR